MVPSILNCDVAERRKRYKKALRQERKELIFQPIKKALPQIMDDMLALVMSAGLFIVIAMCAIMIK